MPTERIANVRDKTRMRLSQNKTRSQILLETESLNTIRDHSKIT